MKNEYTVRDVWSNNDEDICDLLNKYSRTVKEKDKKIQELKEVIAEIKSKAPVDSELFWLLSEVNL